MKLLVITQRIDKKDPVLGFFHNWVGKLSEKFEKINVICLGVGEYNLPQNVSVHSLGKQNIVTRTSYLVTRLKYVWKFYKYIWQLRSEYDAVFVHMNQEYVILGWKFWKLLDKKIFLWRNHPKGNFFTDIAAFVSEKVFYTSPQSYTAKFKNSFLMPVGIDTDKFKVESEKRKINSILSLGRISPIKNIHKLIKATILLDKRGVDFVLTVVGDPANSEDFKYYENLKTEASILLQKGKINFIQAVPQESVASIYQNNQIFVNLTQSGSMDKTILEAIGCGCIPVVANEYYKNVEGVVVTSLSDMEIAQNLENALNTDQKEAQILQKSLRQYVVNNHGLSRLIDLLSNHVQIK